MKRKQFIMLLLIAFVGVCKLHSQTHRYYVRAISPNFEPELVSRDGKIEYVGQDARLATVFNTYTITRFDPIFLNMKRSSLRRTFYVESTQLIPLSEFIKNNNHLFEMASYKGSEPVSLAGYPDDYGITGGTNQGASADLSYLDFIGAPQAWDYTVGSSSIVVGISDGKLHEVYTTDDDFKDKTTLLNDSNNYVSHGTNVSALAVAQGNNGHSTTGVCQDCNLLKTDHGDVEDVINLVNAGAKVINCSWGAEIFYDIVDEEYYEALAEETDVIVIAASQNDPWNVNNGPSNKVYPASYYGVISVGGVGSKNVLDCSGGNIQYNIKDYVGAEVEFTGLPNCSTPLEDQVNVITSSTAGMNSAVDILAPGAETFRHYQYIRDGIIEYVSEKKLYTSNATPLVSGTVGLMKDLNNCMPYDEVISVLKITSTNIGHIPANQFAAGNYGSGSLHAGRAVQLTHNLITPDSTAYLQNQKFTRWDFVFNAVSEKVIMQNQEFQDSSTVAVLAKNEIVLKPGTLLEPNNAGFALFEIDSNLTIDTNCITTESVTTLDEDTSEVSEDIYGVYPTRANDVINVVNRISDEAIITEIHIYDIFNQLVQSKAKIQMPDTIINVSHLPSGIYIVKGYTAQGEEFLTTKFIKQ